MYIQGNKTYVILSIILQLLSQFVLAQNKILMFVSHEETYYSEYVVMREALTHSGFEVEVRSATTSPASTYMIPANTTIEETANTLAGSSYTQFQQQYQDYFGNSWNPALNPTPATIPVSGSILDVPDMHLYAALVVAGGIGAQAYNVDGTYDSQGAGPRLISATIIQNVAEKLNSLAVEAIIAGKPVMGQCHGAGIPAHWRYPIPDNTPLGTSILSGNQATGFPETATGTTLNNLGINYLSTAPVVISSPHFSVPHNGNGNHKIITTRDWYPQTIAHAAMTLINILHTFPSGNLPTKNILILHGGQVNPSNCHYTNRANDIPCNYGNDIGNLPADYTHLQSLLLADSQNDNLNFNVSTLHLTAGNLPFDSLNECSIFSYLRQFDAIIFFKHWSTGITPALQYAIITFADNGGGVIGIHHGLYNDVDGPTGYNKDILANELFKVQSSATGWGASRINYNVYNTNPGHYITTNGINYSQYNQAPGSWFNAIPLPVNTGYSYYSNYTIFDEIYTNTAFSGNPALGRNMNQTTPLLGIGNLNGNENFTSGITRLFDQNLDGKSGKVVFLQPGENKDNYTAISLYGQMIRNAVFWAGAEVTIGFPEIIWNTNDGGWENSGHWNTMRIPGPCDHVVLPDHGVAYSVIIPQGVNYVIKSITIEQNVTLIIPANSLLVTQE